MNARKSISVSRTYRHEPENCLRALITLLKKPVSTEGCPERHERRNQAWLSRHREL